MESMSSFGIGSLFQKNPSLQNINTSQLSTMPQNATKGGFLGGLFKGKGGAGGAFGGSGGGAPSIAGAIGQGADMLGSFFPGREKSETTNTLNAAHDATADTLGKIPTPWTQIASAAMKVQSSGKKIADTVTGGKTAIDNPLTTGDKILDSNWAAFTPTALINSFTKKKIKGSDTEITKEIDRGYQPSTEVKSSEIGGVSRLFGGKKRMKEQKRLVARTDRENAFKASNVQESKISDTLTQNTIGGVTSRNAQSLLGGLKTNAIAAKQGAKLLNLKNIKRNVLHKLETTSKTNDVTTPNIFKDGGKINVIPEGALHARKHNLEGYGKDITSKGIPVISGDLKEDSEGTLILQDGGEVTQHAEIEKNEIIFHKELTLKLEELLKKYEDGDKDAAIEAGKLLTYEILENTNDNTGLLNEVQ